MSDIKENLQQDMYQQQNLSNEQLQQQIELEVQSPQQSKKQVKNNDLNKQKNLVMNLVNKENFNQRQFQQFKRYDIDYARFQIPYKKRQIQIPLSASYSKSLAASFDYSSSTNFSHTHFKNENLDVETKIQNLKSTHNQLPKYYDQIYKIANKKIDQIRIFSAINNDFNEKHTKSQIVLGNMDKTVKQMRQKNEQTLNQVQILTKQVKDLNDEIYRLEKLKQKLDESHVKNHRNSNNQEKNSHQKKQQQIAVRGNILKFKQENQNIYDSVQKILAEDQKVQQEIKKTEQILQKTVDNFKIGKQYFAELKLQNEELKNTVMVRSKFLQNIINVNNGLKSYNRENSQHNKLQNGNIMNMIQFS